MDVLDALEATAHIADGRHPDALLVELGQIPGVDTTSIRIHPMPRPGRHGRHVATWTQDATPYTVEGHTLDVALRRALRRSSAVSAKAGES